MLASEKWPSQAQGREELAMAKKASSLSFWPRSGRTWTTARAHQRAEIRAGQSTFDVV